MCGLLHVLTALLSGKDPPVPTDLEGCVDHTDVLDALEMIKNLALAWDSNLVSSAVDPVAESLCRLSSHVTTDTSRLAKSQYLKSGVICRQLVDPSRTCGTCLL